MVAINIKQRKELISEMKSASTRNMTFKQVGNSDDITPSWNKLIKLLIAEEQFSLVGKECEKKDE